MIFKWLNFEEYIQYVLDEEVEPEWVTESSLGRSKIYDFDTNVVDGRMEFLEYHNELKVLVFDCFWHKRREFYVQDDDWVRFNFSQSIDIVMELSADKSFSASRPLWQLFNSAPNSEVHEIIPAQTKTVWLTVCCKPELISELLGRSLEDMPDILKLAMASQDFDCFHECYEFTSILNALSKEVIRTSMKGGIRLAYIKAKVMELLCIAINEIVHQQKQTLRVKLSERDKAAIIESKEYLSKNYRDPPSIVALGRKVGLNRNKLYYGFKSQCGETISEYIQSLRLEEGRELLLHTDKPITDIAYDIGFKHQCNFSTAMKRHFGVTPRKLRTEGGSEH